MSIFDHLQSTRDKGEEGKGTCKNCGKKYTWSEGGPYYEGHTEREYINCPYCNSENGYIRTNGFLVVNKAE